MAETAQVRQYGYRTARYPFPKMVNVELPQGMSSRVIGTHGIDISLDGIAVAIDVEFDPIIVRRLHFVYLWWTVRWFGFPVGFFAKRKTIAGSHSNWHPSNSAHRSKS